MSKASQKITREITRDILESFLKCKHKAHLQLMGKKGINSDFENMQKESWSYFKQEATQKILYMSTKSEILRNATVNNEILNQGAEYVINSLATYDHFSILFDGLKKEATRSKSLNFYYIPILFVQTDKIHVYEKRLLSLYGLILANIQGEQPRAGIIIHGQNFKTAKIRLSPNIRKSRNFLEEIKDIQKGLEPPLILNEHCHICEFQQRCFQKATEEENLSLLRGMTEKQISKYNSRGILTVSQLSYTYRARKKRSSEKCLRHDFSLQALALRDKCVYITEIPVLEHKPVHIFFDIEGIPDRSFNYLIGALICTPNSETQYSFWADTPSQEVVILNDFLNLIETYEHFHVFHYGAYDVNFLKQMRGKTELYGIIDKILQNSTNVLSLIYGHIYFPGYSNGLKHIAPLLGYSWSDNHASGINSLVWRNEWEKNKRTGDRKRLITYNSNDCAALKVVTDFIYAIDKSDNKSAVGDSINIKNQQVSYLKNNTQPTYSRPDWRTPQFKIEDLDYINRCSYFDYQREKIYVRTNNNIAKQQAKKKKHPKWIKPTKQIQINCSACPYCGSINLSKCPGGMRRRKCLDLKITKKCVKRVVQEHAAYKYHCGKCGKDFFPEKYMKMFKYGHSLKSWAMYEYVAHRATFNGLEGTFRDLFDLPVCLRHIHSIKRIMANYYQETVEGIRRRLVAGSILHADETPIKLQRGGKGYIWVFANLEEVLYVFTRSRDGGFLSTMFEGFSGVIISDFYAVYDWTHCEQQKCLVHLIRDLNNELLRNPFDEEYKELVAKFGSLLRKIIATVDRYGLKRRNLSKHQREVDKFFSKLEGQYYRSGIAKSAQERLIRYKDRLFTFIK
jgi:predicted RecB family nuclease